MCGMGKDQPRWMRTVVANRQSIVSEKIEQNIYKYLGENSEIDYAST
jgi:hypothetical protein